jgi:acyl-CoA reductase-like NAD-dependent aldehyde dehydrogenase
VDHQSPLEAVAELLAQQIAVAQAKREVVLDLADAASRIYRLWSQLSLSGRREFLRKLKECARHLAGNSLKGVIRLEAG